MWQRRGPFSLQQKWRTLRCLRSRKVRLIILNRTLDAGKIRSNTGNRILPQRRRIAPGRHVEIAFRGIHQGTPRAFVHVVRGKTGLAVG